MRKLLFLFILLFSTSWLFAQKKSQIQLTSSQSVRGIGTGNAARFIRPVFTHEGSTLSADSADYNQAGNAFDAYGHVVITQPDGTTIYSDILNYDGNTRIAILRNNIRLVDGDAVLTTNHLTYNMGTRMGTYIGGGKIVNGQNVLTSTNGYYFASTRDAYFRYNVVVNTPDSEIRTDTLKYNSEAKIAWFYGPTNILGKGANKESKLYTENGRYNTITDQAWFGKKNLYTEGSKSLKGDSLFYDGKAGFGKAINNITFQDTVQKVILKGNQGIYHKADESALVTKNAYVIIEAEQDSASVDSIWMTADTLRTKMIPMKDLVPANPEELKSDEELEDTDPIIEGEGIVVPRQPAEVPALEKSGKAATDVEEKAPSRRRGLFGRRRAQKEENVPKDSTESAAISPEAQQPVKPDSVASVRDTTGSRSDTLSTDSLQKLSLLPVGQDSLKRAVAKTDSIARAASAAPLDTTLVRVIYAYNNVKIFKSDLQSRSDSAFYSYADSIIRCYVNPIIWTQGTQLTADTIYMQMKDRKLDNMLLQGNGFIVSTEGDSSKFNQVKGKVVTGLFEESKLKSMYVDGNAESIYYTLEDSVYTGMNRSLSSRMRLEFADNKLQRVMLVRKPEGKYYPIEKIPKDLEILEGFIWKPKERPKSKEEIIPTLRPKTATTGKASSSASKPVSATPVKASSAGKTAPAAAAEPRDTKVDEQPLPTVDKAPAPVAVADKVSVPEAEKPEIEVVDEEKEAGE